MRKLRNQRRTLLIGQLTPQLNAVYTLIDWKVMNSWTDECKYVKCLSEAKGPNETVTKTDEEEASSF